MDIKKLWQHWVVELGKSSSEVAREVGQSPANLNKKIANESIKAAELGTILEKYGYILKIVKKD